MTERLFGLETEYGLAATTCDGGPVDNARAAAELLTAARRCLPSVPGVNPNGFFLGNGARFYLDSGAHPEFATPEVSAPEAAVAHVAAGERILARLAEEVSRTRKWRVMLLRSNVDYHAGATYGRHESYLRLVDAEHLADQLIPHIVARVIYGAGGFNPKSHGIEFSLSPRSAFFSTVVSERSTENRGIIHTKNEPLAGLGYGRFHIICPGDTLLSQTGIYLHVATTALLVALVEAGERPGDAVRLAAPVAALRGFAADPLGRWEARLERGGTASALAIERHYLEWAERSLDSACLPAWAKEACARWRVILDRLEEGPGAVAGTLDWATKWIVYGDHAGERGFDWRSLAFWTEIAHALHVAMKHASVKALSCEEALAPDSPIRDRVQELTPRLERRGETWDRLRRFVDLRLEFHELDTRWGILGEAGIWSSLDEGGLLSHRILEAGTIETTATTPPPIGRAKLRGEFIQMAHKSGSTGIRADWDRVLDEKANRILDLSDPFATEIVWRPLEKHAELRLPTWPEILSGEIRFAREHPTVFRILSSLARLLPIPDRAAAEDPLAHRALALVERSFPPDHPIVAACLRDLAERLGRGSRSPEASALIRRADAIRELNARRQAMGPEHPDVALACNELAICLRGVGMASRAEPVLRQAIAIEEQVLPADHPRHPHRLSNLASVLLMQDKRDEARGILHRAWQLQRGRHDLTSGRILCLRLALDWVEERAGAPFLGQMKTLLAEPELGTRAGISASWDVAAVWESLRPRLPDGRLALLRQIAAVLNDWTRQGELEESRAWRESPSISIDAPWPESTTAAADPGSS